MSPKVVYLNRVYRWSGKNPQLLKSLNRIDQVDKAGLWCVVLAAAGIRVVVVGSCV